MLNQPPGQRRVLGCMETTQLCCQGHRMYCVVAVTAVTLSFHSISSLPVWFIMIRIPLLCACAHWVWCCFRNGKLFSHCIDERSDRSYTVSPVQRESSVPSAVLYVFRPVHGPMWTCNHALPCVFMKRLRQAEQPQRPPSPQKNSIRPTSLTLPCPARRRTLRWTPK